LTAARLTPVARQPRISGEGPHDVNHHHLILTLVFSALPAEAGKRADCKRTCNERIAACQALNTDFGTLAKGLHEGGAESSASRRAWAHAW